MKWHEEIIIKICDHPECGETGFHHWRGKTLCEEHYDLGNFGLLHPRII